MVKQITAKELFEKINSGEKVNIIDVREETEVAAGAIPGAKHTPLGEIPLRLHELKKEEHYYFICRSGARSWNACFYLTQLGYNVTNIAGGMLEWEGEVVQQTR